MGNSSLSFYSTVFGFIAGGISLLGSVVAICRPHLPSKKIKKLESLLHETDSAFKEAVEAGLLVQEFIERTECRLSMLRDQARGLRARACKATRTLHGDYVELFSGTSIAIGSTCQSLKNLRADIILAGSSATTEHSERRVMPTGGLPPMATPHSVQPSTDSNALPVAQSTLRRRDERLDLSSNTTTLHRESPVGISEMEQVSGVSAQELAMPRPSLERVREKLRLASTPQTTLVEDIAYSLLGIFNATIPVIYDEGNRALGRLLEHVLTNSGDTTILAWTGHAGSYNSCLPVNLEVYKQPLSPHIPQVIETVEIDRMVTTLRASLPDLSLAVTLHDHLSKLSSPHTTASGLRVAVIAFPVTKLVRASKSDANSGLHVYRATTATLGDVEIETADNFSGGEGFVLIHPWISPLLDQDVSHCAAGLDDTTRALRLVARLRQPFGALLLTPQTRVQYKRVATDSLIKAQVREETLLNELIDGIRMIDIL